MKLNWKTIPLVVSIAAAPLITTCSSTANQYQPQEQKQVKQEQKQVKQEQKQVKQEKIQYQFDGKTVTINVCQNQLTPGQYEQIKTLSIRNREMGSTIKEANIIMGCTFQRVKKIKGKDQYIWQAVNTNSNGQVTRQVILGTQKYKGNYYVVRKEQRGLY